MRSLTFSVSRMPSITCAIFLALNALFVDSPALAAAESEIHKARALRLAGEDMLHTYAARCRDDSVSPVVGAVTTPTKVFDNLIYLGPGNWNAWVLITSEGLIVFDPLETRYEAEDYIVNGLRELGYDPAQIKHIIVMHGHGDHFGGSSYLHETFGADVYMSEIDWELAENTLAENGPRKEGQALPIRDKIIENGMTLTFGDTSIQFIMTPGHTAGTVSALFTVRDGESEYLAGYLGGIGFTAGQNDLSVYQNSLRRYEAIAQEAGAEVVISNHPQNDMTIARMHLLAQGESEEVHPFVIGTDGFSRFLEVVESCVMYAQAEVNERSD